MRNIGYHVRIGEEILYRKLYGYCGMCCQTNWMINRR